MYFSRALGPVAKVNPAAEALGSLAC